MKLYGVCVVAIALCAGCGGDDDEPAADAAATTDGASGSIDSGDTPDATNGGPDAQVGPFALTSTAYANGGVIPLAHVCPRDSGSNISPQLAWTNPPPGTMSFAIVFEDVSTNFLHSAIWDIPANRSDLPEDVDKDYEPADVPGAKQPNSYLGVRGYAGPCPDSVHTYEHQLHAIGVATLPNLDENSTRQTVTSAIRGASIGSVVLSGTYDPN